MPVGSDTALVRRGFAELLGTMLLVAAIVGSGIAAQRLSPAEVVATAGLVLVIFGVTRAGRANVAPFAVAAYITDAYFFTASTSFANPAVTIGRMLSDTFAGIEPASVPIFIAFQLVGGAVALVIVRVLYPDVERHADAVIVPHEPGGGAQ